MGRKERREERRRKGRGRHEKPAPVRRRMAVWEWVAMVSLLLFVLIQVVLRLTGRPGFSAPHWVDAPPYYPGR
jgi:hypothetical protein